ncbi:hypothetical protein HIM_09762 [Hirsutella minnesotensis 3608]|uniref:DDE-1 domain-containing protein n=1 Tax=Hirsutella minnesotensis 3608 TaxID=1043627 RepID=A0A0F7ZS70_9HYPO|nr:hypothetical protein HIM_09762 [Hirsutella minnesotensis 3608]
MGVIATAKVVTQTKRPTKDRPRPTRSRSGRPMVIQPGDRTWVTVIEGVNATGWALPFTIIFEGKVHQSTWYQTGIPRNWVIGVSENGWTNNDIGFKWLTEVFDKHSRGRAVGKYRLLLLDGHGSHFTPEFDDFCKKNSIVWLCYPPHSTHLFSYGRLVQEKAELGTFHIDKTDFLVLYHQAHRMTFTEKTIKNAFEAVGITPLDPQRVLSRLNVRTPSPVLQATTFGLQGLESRLLPKTPHNIIELEAQVKALQEHRTRAAHEQGSPTDQAVRYLVKGCQMAMHGATLLSEENERLRSENQRQRGKKNTRRSYVAHGGVLAVEKGLQLAEERVNGVKRSRVVKYVICILGGLSFYLLYRWDLGTEPFPDFSRRSCGTISAD